MRNTSVWPTMRAFEAAAREAGRENLAAVKAALES
jgi:hypothetical protein